jgi:hypothetical protein
VNNQTLEGRPFTAHGISPLAGERSPIHEDRRFIA